MYNPHSFGLGTKASSIQIASLVIQDTGTYNTQYHRPYNCIADGATMNVLVDRFSSNQYRQKVAPSELSDIASSIIQLQPNAEGIAVIDNSWNEKRARFLMHVIVTFQTGGVTHYNISGYTNYLGVGNNGAFAPDMTFYVNSINMAKETYVQTSTGTANIMNSIESTHVHADHNWTSNGAISQPGQKKLIRPMDLYNTVNLNHVMTDLASTGAFDTRNTIRNTATLSHRQNSLPSNYVAKVFEARLQANHSTAGSGDTETINTAAAGIINEPQGFGNPFLKTLAGVKGNNTIGNEFTIRDLLDIDPNVAHVMSYVPVSGGNRQAHQAGFTSDWNGSDAVTIAASTLAHAVPAIMMSVGLNKLSFSTTNSTIGGVVITIITGARGFGNGDNDHACEIFKQRFEIEVLRDISINGQRTFAVEMITDLLGETWIKISLDNSGIYDYVAPSFCDALFTPTITQNQSLVTSISDDFNQIVESIQASVNGNQTIIFPTNNIGF